MIAKLFWSIMVFDLAAAALNGWLALGDRPLNAVSCIVCAASAGWLFGSERTQARWRTTSNGWRDLYYSAKRERAW